MYKSLSEYLEDNLEKQFCKKHQIRETWESPEVWEHEKQMFGKWLIEKFSEETDKNSYDEYNGWKI